MEFAQVREIIDVKVSLGMFVVIRNRLQLTCNYCARVTRGVVPFFSVPTVPVKSYSELNCSDHIHALIYNYRVFVSRKIVELKAV